jgi:hypothetical protein
MLERPKDSWTASALRRRLRSRPPLQLAQSMSAKGSVVPGSSHVGRGPRTLAISFALASALLAIGVTLRSRPGTSTELLRQEARKEVWAVERSRSGAEPPDRSQPRRLASPRRGGDQPQRAGCGVPLSKASQPGSCSIPRMRPIPRRIGGFPFGGRSALSARSARSVTRRGLFSWRASTRSVEMQHPVGICAPRQPSRRHARRCVSTDKKLHHKDVL